MTYSLDPGSEVPDIEIKSDPAFNKAFEVQSNRPHEIQNALTPDLRLFLLSDAAFEPSDRIFTKNLFLEWTGDTLVAHRNTLEKEEGFRIILDRTLDIYNMLLKLT
ncbi:hypothetical protein ACFL27_06210 [candidate division CSSED10-310 bacterium]|uniref:Uncharacterized protein n=1 Tax=candidate division CSSED10-310 bacterium TaxID=2855610 RepID=A0ABV6YUA1_UNCC1